MFTSTTFLAAVIRWLRWLSAVLHSLFVGYWHSLLKRPLDNIHDSFSQTYNEIREVFFRCEWNEVYDFVEFTADNGPEEFAEQFRDLCNSVLERENSGYRFVSKQITQITDAAEIASIQAALAAASPIASVKAHLETALSLLSDRKKPDFRNSIKESISATEALAKKMSGNPKATLGDALKMLESKNCLHGSLKNSLSAPLWVYERCSRHSSRDARRADAYLH